MVRVECGRLEGVFMVARSVAAAQICTQSLLAPIHPLLFPFLPHPFFFFSFMWILLGRTGGGEICGLTESYLGQLEMWSILRFFRCQTECRRDAGEWEGGRMVSGMTTLGLRRNVDRQHRRVQQLRGGSKGNQGAERYALVGKAGLHSRGASGCLCCPSHPCSRSFFLRTARVRPDMAHRPTLVVVLLVVAVALAGLVVALVVVVDMAMEVLDLVAHPPLELLARNCTLVT